jgi:Tol biopolymer transport system component
MKRRCILPIGISFILMVLVSCSVLDDFPALKGSYLGQKPPGMTPEIFAPGIISTRHYENSITFSPDGNEIYYAIASRAAGRGNLFVILFTKKENKRWIRPQVTSFSGKYVDGFPCISPDGKHLYFSSYRPLEENGEPKNDWDIWAVDKTDHGWSEPYNLDPQINTDERESSPTVTLDGTMYFKRSGSGYSNIYRSRPVNGKYSEPEILSNSINSETSEAHPFIAPDESYLLFSSWRRQDGFGEADIYVSFRKSDGTWTEAVNLGEKINTSAHENCPIISPDGRFLFFNSYKNDENQSSYWKKPLSYDEVLKKLDTIYNGFPNIYWVDAKIIEDLKPDEMK